MKRILAAGLALVLVLLFAGCSGKEAPQPDDTEVVTTEETDVEERAEEPRLVNIVDLAEVNHIGTDDAEEVFYQEEGVVYTFPSIRSAYIECQFSDGSTMPIVQAIESGKAAVSDLDTYGIKYWTREADETVSSSQNADTAASLPPKEETKPSQQEEQPAEQTTPADNGADHTEEATLPEGVQEVCDGVPLAPEGFKKP